MCFPLFLSLWFAEHSSDLFCNTRWLRWSDTSLCWCQELQPSQSQPAELHVALASVLLLDAGGEPPQSHMQLPVCSSLLTREH